MITLFTTAKPFVGQTAVTQYNTLACWRTLMPQAEVLLVGEEKGAAEAAKELGLRLVPDIERSEFGTPLLNSVFSKAEEHASFPLLMYANADILFTRHLPQAVKALSGWRKPFLLVGRRWDTDLSERIDFSKPDWEQWLIEKAKTNGKPGIKSALDYFMFPKGAWGERGGYAEIPPLAIGRFAWDNWLVFWALARKMDVINGSDFILAVHQNHDYSHHPQGQYGVMQGEEARRNFALASYARYLYNTLDATHRIRPDGKIVRTFSSDILKRRLRTAPDLLRVWILGRKRWKPS
ncbi:MAG: hypothetical protein ABSC61_01350 [Anaerolineales bacterium]